MGLTYLIDKTTGALTIEGSDAHVMSVVAADLLPPPTTVNCARPLDRQVVDIMPNALGYADLASGAYHESDVLFVHKLYRGAVSEGPGRRNVLQVQGCPIRCPGCYVPETHKSNLFGEGEFRDWRESRAGIPIAIESAVTLLMPDDLDPPDGITILGGEPFAQFDALKRLLAAIKAYRPEMHTCVYTGYTIEALVDAVGYSAFLNIEMLIEGPYIRALAEGAGEYRGSRNQRIIENPAEWRPS